jgi:hypothetical protein
VKLNDGNSMPQVGFGLWKVDNATCANTVYEAIKTGYRLFDGACGMCFLPPYTPISIATGRVGLDCHDWSSGRQRRQLSRAGFVWS